MDKKKLVRFLRFRNITFDFSDEQYSTILRQELTLQNLFDLAPHTDEILQECKYRVKGSYLTHENECQKAFRIRKYFHLHFLCYRFIQQLNKFDDDGLLEEDIMGNQSRRKQVVYDPSVLFQYNLVANTAISPRLFAEFLLKKGLFNNLTSMMSFQFSAAIDFPRRSDSFPAIATPRFFRSNKGVHIRRFYISYGVVIKYLLPPPYQTSCRNYSLTSNFVSDSDCKDTCVLWKVAEELNRIPQTCITVDGYDGEKVLKLDKHMIQETDMENKTFRELYFAIETFCSNQCALPDCNERIYVTRISRTEVSSTQNYRVKLLTNHGPSIAKYTIPKQTFVQYLVLFCNAFSFWAGLSILKLSYFPVTLFQRQKTENKLNK